MPTTINDVALAVYISKTGRIVAAESINGSREIQNNQLDLPCLSDLSGVSDILKVDVRVDLIKRSEPEVRGGCGEFSELRVCYDKSGNRVPCY
jgi:hypothetical protein